MLMWKACRPAILAAIFLSVIMDACWAQTGKDFQLLRCCSGNLYQCCTPRICILWTTNREEAWLNHDALPIHACAVREDGCKEPRRSRVPDVLNLGSSGYEIHLSMLLEAQAKLICQHACPQQATRELPPKSIESSCDSTRLLGGSFYKSMLCQVRGQHQSIRQHCQRSLG